MSLIIKGMKMPEYKDVFGDKRGCVYLHMLTVNKDSTASMQFNDVDGGFHRVKEISAPHGRLIDADELNKKLERYRDMCGDIETQYGIDTAIRILNNTPTIIEAEVSE